MNNKSEKKVSRNKIQVERETNITFQYLIKNTELRFFRKNNHWDSDKNKLRTFEPRGGENIKNVELQRKKSGSYKKSVQSQLDNSILKPSAGRYALKT